MPDIPLGSAFYTPGSLDFFFNSIGGVENQGISTDAFGIFFTSINGVFDTKGQERNIGNSIVFGFGDLASPFGGGNDNHDDLIISASFTPAPEPAT